MKTVRSALLINRYIVELQRSIAMQERRISSMHEAGLQDVGEACQQLETLRGSLAALQFRARGIASER